METRFVRNGDVRIRYLVAGSGPPLLLLHGFPDHALGWRHQIEALSDRFLIIAPNLRGVDGSDAPPGAEHYGMAQLVSDVLAVLARERIGRAAIAGHDWGGGIAWWLAIRVPQAVSHLVALASPHPALHLRSIRTPQNTSRFEYMRRFLAPGSEEDLDIRELSRWVRDPRDREELEQALHRSDLSAMMNLYRANIPPDRGFDLGPQPKVRAPTLVIYGEADPYVPKDAFVGIEDFVSGPTVTIPLPSIGHFVHHDASETVNREIANWILVPRAEPSL